MEKNLHKFKRLSPIIRSSLILIIILLFIIGITIYFSLNRQERRIIARAAGGTANINVSPANGILKVNSLTTVNVSVNGRGKVFNAAQATVTVSANLSVTGLSITPSGSGGCNFTYAQTPSVSNPSFAGAILASSFPYCTVYTLTLNPTSSGKGTITISNASVKAYSNNSEILSSVTNGSYKIISQTPTPTLIQVLPTATITPRDKIKPGVSIVYPKNGSTVFRNTNITVVATADDNKAGTRVLFYRNNRQICSVAGLAAHKKYGCNMHTAGVVTKVTYKVKAYDAAGNSSSSSVEVRAK